MTTRRSLFGVITAILAAVPAWATASPEHTIDDDYFNHYAPERSGVSSLKYTDVPVLLDEERIGSWIISNNAKILGCSLVQWFDATEGSGAMVFDSPIAPGNADPDSFFTEQIAWLGRRFPDESATVWDMARQWASAWSVRVWYVEVD